MPAHSSVAVSGFDVFRLPTWGRSFWQDARDGNVILLYASGSSEIDFVYSSNSGISWSPPTFVCPVDNFEEHNNFDTAMDGNGNVHCVHRYADSGCYTFVAKNFITGGWEPSGVIARGFVTAGDSGNAKGVQASIEVTQTFTGPFGFNDVAGPFPVARIPAKNADNIVENYWVPNPFSAFPQLDSLSPVNTIFPAGRDGGYPVFNTAGSIGRQVIYMADATGLVQANRIFFDWSYRTIPIDDPLLGFGAGTPEGSGYVSLLPFGPNMAFAHATPYVGPIGGEQPRSTFIYLLSDNTNVTSKYEALTASIENNMTNGVEDSAFNIINFFGQIDSVGEYTQGARARAPLGLTWDEDMPPDSLSYPGASGTLIDVSWQNERNTIHIYFLSRENNGEYVISRMKTAVQGDFVGGTVSGVPVGFTTTSFYFPNLTSSTSGIRSWAPAALDYTGGSGNLVIWNGFKALRHPTFQFWGVPKSEIVVTAGSGLDGLYRLVAWDYAYSIDNQAELKLPTFVAERTGLPIASGGIINGANFTDNNTTTAVFVASGDFITYDFGQNYIFNRLEVLWEESFEDFLELQVDSSLDNVNYTRAFTLPSGYGGIGGDVLIQATSEIEIDGSSTPRSHNMAPFVGRYVKLNFDSFDVEEREIRELRFYGVHSTAGEWVSSVFTRNFVLPAPINLGRQETFSTTREGELPPLWATYGDFTWFVRASGAYSDDVQDGTVASGFFIGTSNGNGDGFAARTTPNVGFGQSGVLEIQVTVDASELAFDNTAGRTIAFDMRHDVIGSGVILTETDPGDDKIYFETVTPTGTQRIFYPGRYALDINTICNSNACDWYRYRTKVPVGTSTLRWIYERGNTPTPGINDDEGVVWLDNVLGVGAITQNAIAAFAEGSPFNTNEFTGNSGIYGYLTKRFHSNINAWMNSDTAALTGSINAWAEGALAETGSINAYLYGNVTEFVNAWMSGFVPSINSNINAWMFTSGAFSEIFGYMANRVNESINAFLLAPSGAFESINAWIFTPEFSSINGYISGPGTGVTQINAFLDAKGYQNSINAYMLASGLPNESINAYLFNNGVSSNINGYLSVGNSSEIAAYMLGSLSETGVINAWLSGVGFVASNINSYLAGISGTASGSINSYIYGAAPFNGQIYGVLVGYNDTCDFPLTPLPTFTIPSGNFFQ